MERLIWLDALRGFLLLLICIGHFNDCPSIVSFILKPTSMYYGTNVLYNLRIFIQS